MQAIGSQVFLVLSVPVILFISILYYFRNQVKILIDKIINHYRVQEQQQLEFQNRGRFDNDVCCICLSTPKQLQISGTCSHSFCGHCIFQLYDRKPDEKVLCPLCRQQIITFFQCFPNNLHSHQQMPIRQGILLYNAKFQDSRSFWRKICQVHYVIYRLRHYLLRPSFVFLFLTSVQFFWILVIIFLYLLSPFDLMPEYMFGTLGYLDDLILTLLLMYFITGTLLIIYHQRI